MKNQKEMLEIKKKNLKQRMPLMKIITRLDMAKKIGELENMSTEMSQTEEQREKKN